MKAWIFGILAAALAAEGATVKTVCASGCDYRTIQAAVDAASFGWVIEVRAGETFTGGVRLRIKEGSPASIVIRSSAIGALPPGKRVSPSDAVHMPKILGGISIEYGGVRYYRLEGLEISASSGVMSNELIALFTSTPNGATAEHELSRMPDQIVIDRCYIHGIEGENGPRRGIVAATRYLEVTNCWFSEIKYDSGEAQAIAAWSAAGPMVFRNNHFEAAAITTLFGGAEPNIPGLRATDLRFIGNRYYRPWKWRVTEGQGDPAGNCLHDARGGEYYRNTSANSHWRCLEGQWVGIASAQFPKHSYWQKNHFELKNASRVLFEGNLIENAWLPAAQQQKGAAFLFNQVDFDGKTGERAAVVSWVRVQHNRIRNTPWGVSQGGNGQPYFYRMHDITFENNLFEDLGREPQSMRQGNVLQTGVHNARTRFAHNTVISSEQSGYGSIAQMNARDQADPFTYGMEFYGNIVGFQFGGFLDTDKAQGSLWNAIESQWAAGRGVSKNVVVDTQGRRGTGGFWDYPRLNLLWPSDRPPWSGLPPCASCAVGTLAGGPWYWENGGKNDVGFVSFQGRDYRLRATSPYRNWGHLGRDAGADIDVVEWSTATAASGEPNAYLDFRVRALTPERTSAGLRYTAYSTSACTVKVSNMPDLSAPVIEAADGGGNRDRVVKIEGLDPDTRYFYRVQCGEFRRDGLFLTAQ